MIFKGLLYKEHMCSSGALWECFAENCESNGE